MNRQPDNQNSMKRFPARNPANSMLIRLPFWFSTANYYVLAAALAIAAFFLTWAILIEENDALPWMLSGIVAGLVLIAAVVLRSILMRRMERHFAPDRMNVNLSTLRKRQNQSNSSKLSIEKNALILSEIEKKSKAAQVLGKLPEGHLEVFELCEEYLRRNQAELENVGVGSPRLPVLRKSRERIEKLHKFHLLTWASLESRMLIQDAKIQTSAAEKIENSQRALSVLDSAVHFYPNETLLTDSISVVKEFISTVKVEHWIEQAERAAYKQNYKRAINHYRDALYFLARENHRTPEKELIAEKIRAEIEKISANPKKN